MNTKWYDDIGEWWCSIFNNTQYI